MKVDQGHCPLCGAVADSYIVSMSSVFGWQCARCGHVRITRELLSFFDEVRNSAGSKLSIVSRLATENNSPVTLMTSNFQGLVSDLPRYTPMEKLDLLLQQILRKTSRLGGDSEFSPDLDYPLVICGDRDELLFLLRELSRRGYVELTSNSITPTLEGWQRAEEIASVGRTSDAAFIAMPFDKSYDATYEKCIAPAITEAGYRPLRVDKIEHVNRIDDQIISDIRRSRFMVADLTAQRPGVYFEAGMMLGLGRTVIWMVRQDDLSNVHFDNRQYNFIVYDDDLDEAKKRLMLRILAVEGAAAERVNFPR